MELFLEGALEIGFQGTIVHWNYFPLFIIWMVNTRRTTMVYLLLCVLCLFASCKYQPARRYCGRSGRGVMDNIVSPVKFALPLTITHIYIKFSNSNPTTFYSTMWMMCVRCHAVLAVAMSGKCLTIIGGALEFQCRTSRSRRLPLGGWMKRWQTRCGEDTGKMTTVHRIVWGYYNMSM